MDIKDLLKKLGIHQEEASQASIETSNEEEKENMNDTSNTAQFQKEETMQQNQNTFNQQSGNSNPDNLKALIDYEILNGRQLFVAKYGYIENLDQMLPLIESFAYRDFIAQLQRGEKPSYFKCLEEAKERVVKLFDETAKQLKRLNIPSFREQKESKPKEKPFTLEDMYGEYIKNLKNITTKYNTLIHYGWKPRGVKSIERGVLGLNQISEYKTEN